MQGRIPTTLGRETDVLTIKYQQIRMEINVKAKLAVCNCPPACDEVISKQHVRWCKLNVIIVGMTLQ
jgi:hypothetical protein